MDEKKLKDLQRTAAKLRLNVVRMIGVGTAGHLGGSCSLADIVTTLYFKRMNITPQTKDDKDRDIFLLSKGHAALIQYAALAEKGFFSEEEFDTVKQLGAMLQGHPDRNKTPGVEANTGSLGQGLSIGSGLALAKRLDNNKGRVYVAMGDGELAEGQLWEAAMSCAHHKIDNITAIIDKNGLQATGKISDRMNSQDISKKWEAFGWEVIEVDGHNIAELDKAFEKAESVKGKPCVVIANTIKGKGIPFAENVVSFHNGTITQEQYDEAVKTLKEVIA